MNRRGAVLALMMAMASHAVPSSAQTSAALIGQAPPHGWAIVMHGGAGVIERSSMKPETEKLYRAGMNEAITAAAEVLGRGGHAVDAVEAAIKLLEENPLFNCAHGAVFTAAGKNELDAAIMDGATLNAGTVAASPQPGTPSRSHAL